MSCLQNAELLVWAQKEGGIDHDCGENLIRGERLARWALVLDSRAKSQKGRQIDPAAQVTKLLLDLKSGDPAAVDGLIPIVYDELRRLAAHYLRAEHAAATLQPTALVHEAYLRLVAQAMPVRQSLKQLREEAGPVSLLLYGKLFELDAFRMQNAKTGQIRTCILCSSFFDLQEP